MTQPRKEQINIFRAYWTVFVYTATAGTTSTVLPGAFVSSSITQTSGGDPSTNPPVRGIITTGLGGFVRLRKVDTALTLDDSGSQIFGRLSFSAGNYTITYKKISGGAEVGATLPGSGSYSVQILFPEVMNFGEIPSNADIIYGSSQELTTSDNTFTDLIVTGNTTLGDAGTDTIITNARLASNFLPNIDNIRSIGSSSLRFSTANFTNFTARADITDTIKSNFTATGILVTGTAFSIDGNGNINIGISSAPSVNVGHVGITTTVNGTLVADIAIISSSFTSNAATSIFNGDVSITGTLTVGSFSFVDLLVVGNTTLGNDTSDLILFGGRMISDIIPSVSNTYALGSSSLRFSDINATQFIARADDANIIFSILDATSLLSSDSFDIDGYGSLFIGVTNADTIHIGRSGITTTVDGYLTINPGGLFNTSGTGNINLPNNSNARFRIEGIPVGPDVTAINLDTLTNGDNADILHTHINLSISGIAGETINIGELVAFNDYFNGSSFEPRIYKAKAVSGFGEIVNAVGVADGYADGYVDGYGDIITILTAGEKDIPDSEWDLVPNTSDVGKLAYLSETSGNWTLTAPTTTGSLVLKCGILIAGGSGTSRILIQIGTGVLI